VPSGLSPAPPKEIKKEELRFLELSDRMAVDHNLEHVKKWSLYNYSYKCRTDCCMEGWRKTKNNLIHDTQRSGPNFNRAAEIDYAYR
jgi:hypothetical protein